MSLATLDVNGLYIILFIRGSPPEKNDFHWGLYLHQHPSNGGTKYHVKGLGAGWIADHGHTAGVFKSFLLVGLIKIANVPTGWEDYADQTIRTYDGDLNSGGITCKTWLFKVLELLQKEEKGRAVLKCKDLTALENEVNDWGNRFSFDAADDVQPRPVGASTICGL